MANTTFVWRVVTVAGAAWLGLVLIATVVAVRWVRVSDDATPLPTDSLRMPTAAEMAPRFRPATPAVDAVGESPATTVADADGGESLYSRKLDAWIVAQRFVESRLKSPRSAYYGSLWEGDRQDPQKCVEMTGDGEYRIHGWVDAQNAFGAVVRHDFSMTLMPVASGRWRLVGEVAIEPR